MNELPILGAIAAGLTTYLGGGLGLRLGKQDVLLALTAGMVTGIVILDLLPRALAQRSASTPEGMILAMVAFGAAVLLILDRAAHAGPRSLTLDGHLVPAPLTLHSLLDGLGIGLAFQTSIHAGIAVMLAVIAHDVADGLNTVSLAFAGGRRDIAHRWLILNSVAPLLGVLIGTRLHIAHAPFIAAVAGGLLYVAFGILLPRLRTAPRPILALGGAILGGTFAYAIGAAANL